MSGSRSRKRGCAIAEERGITDATGAETAVRRHLESQHGKKLADLQLRKCWYSIGAARDVWDVEGIVILKKGMFGKEQRVFKYQIDPASGAIIGFEFEEQNER